MRIAIVGCGNIAQVHARVIERLDNAKLMAVADCNLKKAVEMATKYGCHSYESLDDMLDSERIDILHICTPHNTHTDLAITALNRGIHVFMEKPPVINQEQWIRLQEAVRENKEKAKLGFCFQNRYNESVQYVKERVQNGSYGRILGARGIVTWNRNADYYENSEWRGRLSLEGGGVLINQAIHTLDLLQYIIGERPEFIHTIMDRQHLPEEIEVEDTVAMYITYKMSRVCFYATTSYVTDAPPLVEFECESATIRIEDDVVCILGKDGKKQEIHFQKKELLGKNYWGTGHFYAIKEFYRCLEKGVYYPIEIEEIENTGTLLLGAYDGNRKGEGICLKNVK
ncbi:MAG: Gfo/Idh/MocA family oxidoreductase [Lachnospiraceae bacterium]|nr:Gfo/Idh/MocA family oxidoreductase [Lachnospiraceae bacterium]